MSNAVYELVTSKIVEALEAGVCPWRKPWTAIDADLPRNAVSKKPYRGVNLWLLGMSPYADNRWLSFKQANQLGGNVRKGERASIAVFWKMLEADDGKEIPLLRYYSVFNVMQCEGLKLPPLEVPELKEHERIEAAEVVVRGMPNAPRITYGGNGAWYKPSLDLVNVPELGTFVSPDAFYATTFHELGHSTGHESRLNRPGIVEISRFGSASYSREELIAELTSAFLCATVRLDNSLLDNSAAYLAGWLKALKGDPKLIVNASANAQRAADYIRGISWDGAE